MQIRLLRNFLVRHYVHLGYQVALTDYSFLKYSLGFHNNVTIIDVQWILVCLKRCLKLIEFRAHHLEKCLFLNERFREYERFRKLRKQFYPWSLAFRLPTQRLRWGFWSILIVISRQPLTHLSMSKVAYKKNVPSVHFIGTNTSPHPFEYFVPCNILNFRANRLYTQMLYILKNRVSLARSKRFWRKTRQKWFDLVDRDKKWWNYYNREVVEKKVRIAHDYILSQHKSKLKTKKQRSARKKILIKILSRVRRIATPYWLRRRQRSLMFNSRHTRHKPIFNKRRRPPQNLKPRQKKPRRFYKKYSNALQKHF